MQNCAGLDTRILHYLETDNTECETRVVSVRQGGLFHDVRIRMELRTPRRTAETALLRNGCEAPDFLRIQLVRTLFIPKILAGIRRPSGERERNASRRGDRRVQAALENIVEAIGSGSEDDAVAAGG
jgi:hypothetical protein